MNRDDIKYRLRESLESLYEDEMLGEAKKKKKEDKKGDSDKENDDEEVIQYDDVTNFFKKHDSIKQVGVFREAGFSEEDIYSRLPYKKLNQEKNEMGGTYRFSKKEIDALRTVLSKYPGGGKINK